MNEEEVRIAKETLEALFSDSTGEDYPYTEKFGQAVNIGIQALEELEQYRALGTVEELKEAKKLLEKLEELKFANEERGYDTAKDVIQEIINLVDEQPQTDWIPCEEGLPSEYGQYLYTDKNDEVHEGTYCPPIQGMIRGWSTCEAEGFVKLSDDEVIAWQPLPQPYKKEGAE